MEKLALTKSIEMWAVEINEKSNLNRILEDTKRQWEEIRKQRKKDKKKHKKAEEVWQTQKIDLEQELNEIKNRLLECWEAPKIISYDDLFWLKT